MRSSFKLLGKTLSATPFPTRAAILSVLFLAVSIADVAYFLRVASARENAIVAENSLHIADGMPQLLGDELRIRQVLLNLLSNAVKFSDGQDIDVSIDQVGGQVRIVVADRGIGIARDDIAKLFTPFVQVGTDKDKRSHGTGLGLSISRELMALHQGTLELESEPGAGTRAILTFPKARTLPQ